MDEEDDTISTEGNNGMPLTVKTKTPQKVSLEDQMKLLGSDDSDDLSQNNAQSDASAFTSSSASKLKSTSTQGISAQDAMQQDISELVKQWKDHADEYKQKYGQFMPEQKTVSEIRLGINILKS